MVYASTTNGLRKPLKNWSQVNWKQVNEAVKNLRQRIFLAKKLGNWRKLRSLQKLMQRSYANLLLSVRRITQTNKGKATAGIDKEVVNTPEQRVKLVNNWNGGNHHARNNWVLEADIQGFFDNIAHESILKELGNFPKRDLIIGWLKAGFIFEGKYNPTEMGTPQGGVISPLLANIGLDGLENYIKSTNPKLGVVRYADDFVVTARDKGSLEIAQNQIKQWLSTRGLELSAEKTLITSMEEGFDFLGFNHRHYNGKLLIKPSKEKVLDFCKRIGREISAMNGCEQEVVIKRLNPILRGFSNYYKGVVSKQTFEYIKSRTWQYLWSWSKRRHPNKNTNWVRKRYFKTIDGNKWTFATSVSDRRGKEKDLILYPIAYTPIERHVKVKGNASPDDPSLREYWEKRHQKYGKSYWERNSRNYKIAQNQNWKCPICGESLFNGEELDTHHIVPVAQGGDNSVKNLQHLHRACHIQEHSKSKSIA